MDGKNYDKWTNYGFPPDTCGGCGSDSHFRNDCLDNPNKGKYPPRTKSKDGKATGEGKGEWGKGKGVGGVDEEWEEGEQADGQQADEGGSVWENDEDDDADCTWAVDEDDNDVVYAITGAQFFPAEVAESADEEDETEGPQYPSLTPAALQNVFDQTSARSPFDTTAGNFQIAQEATRGFRIYQPARRAAAPSRERYNRSVVCRSRPVA